MSYKQEEQEHLMVCNYIRTNYPNVIFLSDLSGVRLPIGLATKISHMKSDRGIPDLIILEARGGAHGLLIELKKTGTKLYKQNGDLLSSDHIREQISMHEQLRKKGFMCEIAIGFSEATKLIDLYMSAK